MNSIPNPEYIDEENPEWSDEMFAQAVPMMEADPELVAMSKRTRVKNGKGMVQLASDVEKFFPDADSVNEALRLLIRLTTTNRTLLAGQA